MNIVITVSSIPIKFNSLWNTGGAEKIAWDLANALAKNNKVSVLTFGKTTTFKKVGNIDVYFFKLVKHSRWYYLTFGKKNVLKIIRKINPDIINSHIHNIITYILRYENAKKILTLHNSPFEFYNYSIFDKIKFNYFNKKSFNTYAISTVSKHMQKYFSKTLNKKISYIPNGIDLSCFYVKKSIVKKNIILYVGRLEEFKGVNKIIDASKKLEDYEFQFIGSGSLFNSYKSKNVHFLGRIESSELVNYYNKSLISIFPSEYENYPLVGLEAMACGSIVFANNIDGFKEYIKNEENGFLADMKDSNSIVNGIKKITNFKNIDKIRISALKKVSQMNINEMSKMYLKLYNEK